MTATASYFHPDVLNKIHRLELRAQHVVEGFLSGLHQSPYKGFSIEFADHREYVPGDDLRHLDWRLYAKSDKFYIKEYEVETNLRTHLLLDSSASMRYPEHPGTDRMNKWDYAATIAASLAYLLVYQQDGAGLLLFDHEVREQLPISSSRGQLHRLLDVLQSASPSDTTDTGALFDYLADQIPRRSMIVLISDLLTDLDTLIAGLQQFRFSQHDVLVLQVLDADELNFPFTDRTRFEGLEQTELDLITDPQALRSAYLERLNAFISSIRSTCLNMRVDYALLSTDQPVDVAITRFLADRMHRHRGRV